MNTASHPPLTSLQDTEYLVNDYLNNCRLRQLSPKTIEFYSHHLLKFAKRYPVLPDSVKPLEEFIYSFISSGASRHGAFRSIRAFYNYAEKSFSTKNPMKAVGVPRVRPTEKPALTVEQLKKLLGYPGHNPLVRALLHFLADTGCRIGEAANLKPCDIFEESVRLDGKTGQRIVPISPMVRDMIVGIGAGPNGTVFRYNNRTLSDYVCKAGKAAGVPCHSHDFRRTMATLWGGSDLSLKQIGGWKSWKMVEHYSQRRLAKSQDDHKLHSPVALVYGKDKEQPESPPDESLAETKTTGQVYIEQVIKIGKELGLAQSKIDTLEHSLRNARSRGPKYDDLQTILDRYTDYELMIPEAKFLIHALFYHFSRNILETAEIYARDSKMPDCLLQTLYDFAMGDFDPREGEPEKEKLIGQMQLESSRLFSIIAELIKPAIYEHRAQALIYKEICHDDTDIESVKLLETI